MYKIRKFLFFTLIICIACRVQASPLSTVSGAVVKKGVTQIETRLGFTTDQKSSDNNTLKSREQIDYGFTDTYALRIIIEQDKPQSKNSEHKSTSLENRFHLIKKDKYGWDGAVWLTYKQSDGDKQPNSGEIKFISQVQLCEKLELRNNAAISHEFGTDMQYGSSLSLANQVTTKIDLSNSYIKDLRAGIELFNDFGKLRDSSGYNNQKHSLGPVIKGKLPYGLYFETGYRAGISENATDHTYKLIIGMEF